MCRQQFVAVGEMSCDIFGDGVVLDEEGGRVVAVWKEVFDGTVMLMCGW